MSSSDKYNISIVQVNRSLKSKLPLVLSRPSGVSESDMSKLPTTANRKRRMAHTPIFPVDRYLAHRRPSIQPRRSAADDEPTRRAAIVERPATSSTNCGSRVQPGRACIQVQEQQTVAEQLQYLPRPPLKMVIKRIGDNLYTIVKSTVTSAEETSDSKFTSSAFGSGSSGLAQKNSLNSRTPQASSCPKEVPLPVTTGIKRKLSSPCTSNLQDKSPSKKGTPQGFSCPNEVSLPMTKGIKRRLTSPCNLQDKSPSKKGTPQAFSCPNEVSLPVTKGIKRRLTSPCNLQDKSSSKKGTPQAFSCPNEVSLPVTKGIKRKLTSLCNLQDKSPSKKIKWKIHKICESFILK